MTRRSHGRGTPVLRISFRGVGRIERATGFRDVAMMGRLKEMCRTLYEAGREDVLRDIARGRISLRDVWHAYRSGDWQRLPSAQHALPFGVAWERWTRTKAAGYARFAGWVRAALEPEPATLADLRGALPRYRTVCETAGKGAMFNRVTATVRAFLRDTVTTDHVLYGELGALDRLPEKVKRPKGPRDPRQAATVREILGGELGRVWWVLCCSGLLPDEYFARKWAIEDGRLHIKGTKREARDRFVPLLCDVEPPTLTQAQFQRALRLSGLGVRPKDGRDSFALWCDMAGLPLGWKAALLGHAAGSVTMAYGWQESERILSAAEEKLGALVRQIDVGDIRGDTPAPFEPNPNDETEIGELAGLTRGQAVP